MSNYNFDYAALGFKSDSEMKESISRVERKMKMNSDDLLREEIKERHARSNQPFSFEAMNEGARLEDLDRVVRSRIHHEQEQAKIQAEQEERQKLMKAFSDKIAADNEAKAQMEMQDEKEKLEAELKSKIYGKYNVKTDEQKVREEGLSKMLGSLTK